MPPFPEALESFGRKENSFTGQHCVEGGTRVRKRSLEPVWTQDQRVRVVSPIRTNCTREDGEVRRPPGKRRQANAQSFPAEERLQHEKPLAARRVGSDGVRIDREREGIHLGEDETNLSHPCKLPVVQGHAGEANPRNRRVQTAGSGSEEAIYRAEIGATPFIQQARRVHHSCPVRGMVISRQRHGESRVPTSNLLAGSTMSH